MAAKAFKILGCACLQLFISGWVYSFGIFTPYLQQASPSGNNLQEAWITGIGMIGLLSIPSMIIAGIIMSGESGTLDNHNVENSYSKTRQIRLTSLTGSFCYAMLSVAGWSIVADSSFLMYCSYFFIANGMGICMSTPQNPHDAVSNRLRNGMSDSTDYQFVPRLRILHVQII